MYPFSLLNFIINHPLNSQRKLTSIYEFAKWQVESRLALGRPIKRSWIAGANMLVRGGDTGFTGNIYTGLHEFEDMSYLLHALRSDDTFIDVGANVGSYTILACAVVKAQCYAFEPIGQTYEKLSANVDLNCAASRVILQNIAIGAEAGNMLFTSSLDTVNHAVCDSDHLTPTSSVQVATLDSCIRLSRQTMIKIDVEGFETNVVNGGISTLENELVHSVIMELNGSGNRYGFSDQQLLQKMLKLGFRTFSYDPFTRTLFDTQGKCKSSGNTLFIRNESLIRSRLGSAPKISVFGQSY